MLDSETKRHIDAARDVLVGKVPDPKAQVEQITTALIYKFMDDMDRDAQGLGGQPSFFVNGYEKYAWTRLLDPRMGGQERLNLYAEALTLMSQNPHLPQLFRDIFKDAFLPYRDPATLNLFLKEISTFTYDHSENLGDAFEYLLSVLSSQGDAGQFRTPRHIIDFMVNVIDPRKNETMLDPACGTAGFLISAYRHIVEANAGHPLIPDEKKRLADNLVGYDISPDMVRLSLVNMYLHSFPSPHIYEYDTLTSEDRWDDKYDILMANPPFMTPKGGIRPHKRYQVQANRSEVLFVDYIAEHLKPHGRAAVIVPEGIIFQSANAYKLLRKSLVESWGLWAVVSLPAGVFQPYSGVKTSILFLDTVFAKTTNDIVFAKVQNDGFDLGAQRRAVSGSDLPEVQRILHAWVKGENLESGIAKPVSKQRVSDAGDYNLTGDRYRDATAAVGAAWPMVPLGEVCSVETGSREVGGALASGVPSIGGEQIAQDGSIRTGKMRYVSEQFFGRMKRGVLQSGDTLLVKDGATTGKTALYRNEFSQAGVNEHVYLLRTDGSLLPSMLYRLVRSNAFQAELQHYIKGIIGGISSEIREIKIPVPPLDVQQRIVDELDRFQCIIDGANQVIANWRPTFDMDPGWPTVTLGEIFDITSSKRVFESDWRKSGVPFYRAREIVKLATEGCVDNSLFISEEMFDEYSSTHGAPQAGDIMITGVGTLGICYVVRQGDRFYFKDGNIIWLKKKTDNESAYVKYLFQTDLVRKQIDKTAGAVVGTFTICNAKNTQIPLPPLATQQAIVAGIEQEQQAVESCKVLVSTYEAKIAATVARLWNTSSTDDAG